jgi:hypothetical protein
MFISRKGAKTPRRQRLSIYFIFAGLGALREVFKFGKSLS